MLLARGTARARTHARLPQPPAADRAERRRDHARAQRRRARTGRGRRVAARAAAPGVLLGGVAGQARERLRARPHQRQKLLDRQDLDVLKVHLHQRVVELLDEDLAQALRERLDPRPEQLVGHVHPLRAVRSRRRRGRQRGRGRARGPVQLVPPQQRYGRLQQRAAGAAAPRSSRAGAGAAGRPPRAGRVGARAAARQQRERRGQAQRPGMPARHGARAEHTQTLCARYNLRCLA